MGELSKGSGISSIRGGDFELGASGVSAVASSDVVVEDITPLALMPLEDDLGLVLGTGTATFTRSTIKTFDDRNDGLVKTAAIDVAAFEQNGILIEGASTNLLLRSEEFDNAAWLKLGTGSGVAPVVTADFAIAPDGTMTADRIQFDTVGSTGADRSIIRQNIVLGVGTQSYFIKSNTGSNQTIGFHRGPAVGAGDLVTVTPEFQRLDIPFTSSSSFFGLEARGTITADQVDIIVWGGDLEALPFASSYIKTVASTVTKTDEDTDIDAANIPAPTADYTISMEVDAIGFDSSLSQVLFNVAGETSRRIAWNTTTGAIEATHGAVTSVSTSTFSAGDRVKISFAVDATNQTLFINGIQEDQDAKGTVTGTATAINIGHQAGVNQAFSHIKPLRINNVALTAEQVAAL